MIIKYKELIIFSMNFNVLNMNNIKGILPSLVMNHNLDVNGNLIDVEEIDEDQIKLIGETNEEILFLLNNSLETSEPANQNEIFKLNARKRIAEEVGDIYDLTADNYNRNILGERLLMIMAHELLNNTNLLPITNQKYGPLVNAYIQVNEQIDKLDTMDLKDAYQEFNKLTIRAKKVTDILQEEYLSKKA